MAEDTREVSKLSDSKENDDSSGDLEEESDEFFSELMSLFVPETLCTRDARYSIRVAVEDSGNDEHALQTKDDTGLHEVAGILHQLITTLDQWLHETPEGKAFLVTILLEFPELKGPVEEGLRDWLHILAQPLSQLNDRSHPHFREIEQWFANYHVTLKMAVNFLHGGLTRLIKSVASKGYDTLDVADLTNDVAGILHHNLTLLGQWLSGSGLKFLRPFLLWIPEAMRPQERDIHNLLQGWAQTLLQNVQLEPLVKEIERLLLNSTMNEKLVVEFFCGGVVGLMNNGACQELGELDGKQMIVEMTKLVIQTSDSYNQWLLETPTGNAMLRSSLMELLAPVRSNEPEYRNFLQLFSIGMMQLTNPSHPNSQRIERLLASDHVLLMAFVKAYHGGLVWLINNQGRIDLSYVNVLRILYEINEKNGYPVSRRLFWLQGLEAHQSLGSHFVQYTKNTTSDSKPFTWLDVPFLLNVRTKWKFVSFEAVDIMTGKMLKADQENNIRRQVNKTPPQAQLPLIPTCLQFHVNRDNIVQSALENVQKYWEDSDEPNTVWLKPLVVNFEGESAVDLGGPSKDFFHHLFSALLDTNIAIFKTVDDQIVSSDVWLQPDYLDYCTLEKIGLLFALLIFNGAITTVPFPELLYEKLLSSRDPVPTDLELIDKGFVKQLYQLRDMTAEDLEALDLDFEGLESGDVNICVTKENLEAYITETMNNRLAIPQLRAFAKGFNRLASLTPLMRSLFKAEDLRDVILGEELDWVAFRRSTRYLPPYHGDYPVIQMFWKVFQELEERDKRRFLKFLTGADHVPLGGFVPFPVRMLDNKAEKYRHPIEPNKFPEPGDLMPEVMTCKGFLSMDLPEYKTEEDLRIRLMLAMNTDGFHREAPNRLSATAPCCHSPMLQNVIHVGIQLVCGGMR